MLRRIASLLGAAAFLLGAAPAGAFCRTTTCDPLRKPPCATSEQDPNCITEGAALFWPSRCIGIALQQDASQQVPYDEFDRVVRAAFAAWNDVRCDGEAPSIQVEVLGQAACTKQEFNDNFGNANLLLFREDTWPYEGQANVLALTTITFGVETGIIYDADMEINAVPSRVRLTTSDDTKVNVDLQSILAHEAGHLLGLAHSSSKQSTMTPIYTPGSTHFRELDEDDAAGLCTAYPPGRTLPDGKPLPACDASGPSPRSQGFSSLCGGTDKPPPPDDDEGKNCDCVLGAGRPGASASSVGLLALGLGAVALRRRRRGPPA